MIRIKEIMKEKGLTARELAAQMGVSPQALGRQIQGKLLVETAERIAAALGVPAWQLLASPEEAAAGAKAITLTCPDCGRKITVRATAD